jgi:3-hydroxyacyl-CoA dehydrogenase / enoyl-CoA hydratase / 3-hydroxybutyryl-CoA epimerase
MNQTLTLTVDADGIALITIDVQGRPMNVITPEFAQELTDATQRLATDTAIRGAVITSSKADFMAGADLKWLLASIDNIKDAKSAMAFAVPLNTLYRKLETCGKPLVAAINGIALGGGLELALACHYRIAADNPATRLGLPEVLVGLLPGAGGTQRLPRLIGVRDAMQIMVEGTHLTVAEAAAKKIVDKVVASEQLIPAARQWILDGGVAGNPWDGKNFKVPGGAGGIRAPRKPSWVVPRWYRNALSTIIRRRSRSCRRCMRVPKSRSTPGSRLNRVTYRPCCYRRLPAT